MTDWYKNIKIQLNELPGEFAHQEMYPGRPLTSSFHDLSKAKASAVMCLLYQDQNNQAKGILMERQDDGGKHSGQISFPGGKKEQNDPDLLYTALRETEEEIGLSAKKIEVLGALSEVYIPVSNFLVQPYIGFIRGDFELIPSNYEVKQIIHFSITDLMNDQTITKKDILSHSGTTLKGVPCFYLENKIVWGATSLILNELKYLLKRIPLI